MTRTLVARAFEDPSVHTVVAHTLPERAPAASVLTANGLVRVQSRRRDEAGPGGAVARDGVAVGDPPADPGERRPGPLSDTGRRRDPAPVHPRGARRGAGGAGPAGRRRSTRSGSSTARTRGPSTCPPRGSTRAATTSWCSSSTPPAWPPTACRCAGSPEWARRAPRTPGGRGSPTPTARCPWTAVVAVHDLVAEPDGELPPAAARARTAQPRPGSGAGGTARRAPSAEQSGGGRHLAASAVPSRPLSTTNGPRPGWRCGAVVARSGDRIRTCDLWVMSPASYRAAPPRVHAVGESPFACSDPDGPAAPPPRRGLRRTRPPQPARAAAPEAAG